LQDSGLRFKASGTKNKGQRKRLKGRQGDAETGRNGERIKEKGARKKGQGKRDKDHGGRKQGQGKN
jgi:hypothetical protein